MNTFFMAILYLMVKRRSGVDSLTSKKVTHTKKQMLILTISIIIEII